MRTRNQENKTENRINATNIAVNKKLSIRKGRKGWTKWKKRSKVKREKQIPKSYGTRTWKSRPNICNIKTRVGGRWDSIANVGQRISDKRAQRVCIYLNGDTFKYHCTVSGLALRPHRKLSGREQTFSNFIFGRRTSRAQGSSERESASLLHTPCWPEVPI